MTKKWKIVLILSIIGNLFIVYVAFKALDYRRHVNYFLDKYTNVVEEFAGRKNFAMENQILVSGKNMGNRVVFLGSQITHGWNLSKYFSEYEAINRGISGQRAAGFLLRFRPDIVELNPKAAVIEFSSYNFRPENTMKELEDYIACMVDIARQNGIEPLLTTIVPVREDFKSEIEVPYNVQDSLQVFNRWLFNYCHESGVRLMDFASVLANDKGYLREEFSTGQITLSPAGYDKISAAVSAALKEIAK